MGMNLVTKTFRLGGLTCTACETKIDNKLKKLKGVVQVDVSYVTSLVTISYYEEKVDCKDIIWTIERAGYQVREEVTGNERKHEKSNTGFFLIAGIMIAGLYLIIKNTVGFNMIPEINQNMGYGILFVIGMMTSLHCLAMCGGINLSVCVSYKINKDEDNKYQKLLPGLMYNAGRVVSYTIIGGIIGALGSVISITNGGRAFVSIMAGIFMVIMGLNMLNLFPWLRVLNPHMPKIFARKINSQKHGKGPFIVGLLNGLMPCGPLQAMQLYALGTGSFVAGALSMFVFSLGTVPLMLAFGTLSSLLSAKFTTRMVKISAVLVMVLGLVMFNRGIAFTGFTFHSMAASKTQSTTVNGTDNSSQKDNTTNNTTAVVNGNVQKITTNLQSGEYPEITVQKGIPVEWTIKADQDSLNGCNNKIIIPKYDVEKKLVKGDNVITFTPSETGSFGYSCWMGMIRSSITVNEGNGNSSGDSSSGTISSQAPSENNKDNSNVDNSGLPSGCCGY